MAANSPVLFDTWRIRLSRDLIRDMNYFYAGKWHLARPEIDQAIARHAQGWSCI
jgi:hypothetical protein